MPMAALLLGLAAALPARADDARDHDRARQALEQGEILPLRTILESVERDTPGQIMEVELDRDEGRWIYEIKVLRTGGSLVKLSIDARSGTVLGSRERAAKGAPRAGEKR
ncbi:MAG: PepSY domain-containing protein [Rhodocyclales bacterium]|nr:PepSY domain-containing protein [Rhodocyclales bacterium]